MRFAVVGSIYQDREGVNRLLDSVDGQVNLTILIDGRYPGYAREKSLPDLSTDGTREVCKSYDNTLLVDYPATQIQKRNKYLQLCKRYDIDVAIIADSDEYIMKENADWDTFRYATEKRIRMDLGMYRVYSLMFEDENGWNNGWRPRVFFKPWQIRYDVKHYRLVITGKHLDRLVYEGENGRAIMPGIVMMHHRSVRPTERNRDMDNYEDWLMHHENKSMKRKYNLL